jgi:hypothetical protein
VHERAVAGPQVHPALVVQPLQCLTHGLTGDPEHLRQFALDEVLAGGQPPGDDQFLHRLVDVFTQRNRPIDPASRQFLRQLGRLHGGLQRK